MVVRIGLMVAVVRNCSVEEVRIGSMAVVAQSRLVVNRFLMVHHIVAMGLNDKFGLVIYFIVERSMSITHI